MAVVVRRRDNLGRTVAERLIGQGAREAFEQLGADVTEDMKARLPVANGGRFPRGVDRGVFRRGIRYRVAGAGFKTRLRIYNSTRHAPFVEEGRKRGKQPPTDVILAWVRRRGIGASAFSVRTRRQIAAGTRRIQERATGRLRTRAQSLRVIQRGIAFLIARKIGKTGIPGLFLFRDIPRDYRAKIDQARRQIFARVTRLLNR